jgi:hypothetical protein
MPLGAFNVNQQRVPSGDEVVSVAFLFPLSFVLPCPFTLPDWRIKLKQPSPRRDCETFCWRHETLAASLPSIMSAFKAANMVVQK